MKSEYPPAAVPWHSSTPSAPPSGMSTSAVMLCGRLSTLGAAKNGIDWVPGRSGSLAQRGHQRFLGDHPGQAAAVDRHHLVLAGLHVPGADHRDQPVTVLGGDVVVLGEVGGDVVELPALGVQLE